jgi:hypothetical protein
VVVVEIEEGVEVVDLAVAAEEEEIEVEEVVDVEVLEEAQGEEEAELHLPTEVVSFPSKAQDRLSDDTNK